MAAAATIYSYSPEDYPHLVFSFLFTRSLRKARPQRVVPGGGWGGVCCKQVREIFGGVSDLLGL